MKTKQPTQRNYRFFANKTTNFFGKIAEDIATLSDYKKIDKIIRIYQDFFGKKWTARVVKQSIDIVFN